MRLACAYVGILLVFAPLKAVADPEVPSPLKCTAYAGTIGEASADLEFHGAKLVSRRTESLEVTLQTFDAPALGEPAAVDSACRDRARTFCLAHNAGKDLCRF